MYIWIHIECSDQVLKCHFELSYSPRKWLFYQYHNDQKTLSQISYTHASNETERTQGPIAQLTLTHERLAGVQQNVTALHNHALDRQIFADVLSVANFIMHHPEKTATDLFSIHCSSLPYHCWVRMCRLML